MHLKMAEALLTVHTRRRGQLQGWWLPVGPKILLSRWQHQSRDYGCIFVNLT
jgi:hypothetical protein